MTEKKGLKDAYSLKTPEDSINLYKTWASTYDDDFAKQNDYRSPIEIAKYFEKYSNDEDAYTHELKGDALSGVGSSELALQQYESAFEKYTDNGLKNLVELKINSLNTNE